MGWDGMGWDGMEWKKGDQGNTKDARQLMQDDKMSRGGEIDQAWRHGLCVDSTRVMLTLMVRGKVH